MTSTTNQHYYKSNQEIDAIPENVKKYSSSKIVIMSEQGCKPFLSSSPESSLSYSSQSENVFEEQAGPGMIQETTDSLTSSLLLVPDSPSHQGKDKSDTYIPITDPLLNGTNMPEQSAACV